MSSCHLVEQWIKWSQIQTQPCTTKAFPFNLMLSLVANMISLRWGFWQCYYTWFKQLHLLVKVWDIFCSCNTQKLSFSSCCIFSVWVWVMLFHASCTNTKRGQREDASLTYCRGGLNELSLLAKPLYLNDENHEMIQLTSSYGQQEEKKPNSSLTS